MAHFSQLITDFAKYGGRATTSRDILPDSEDDESNLTKMTDYGSSDEDIEFTDFEINQLDYDIGSAPKMRASSSSQQAEVAFEELDHPSWPIATQSTSSGIFYITPNTHARLDPAFSGDNATKSKRNAKKANEKLRNFNLSRGGFEACYADEPPDQIQKRMDAYALAWEMCLQRCSKVVSTHFSLGTTELCRYVRQDHDCWNWPLNVIPTAIVSLGIDLSDHPIFFGVLERQLKRRARHLAFLRPSECATMPKLMKSFLKQVVSDLKASSEHSFHTLERYVEFRAQNEQSFSLTVIVENIEQWTHPQVLSDFIALASDYSKVLKITLVITVSSTKNSLFNAISADAAQCLSSRSFSISPSTTAIDLILKHTIFAADAPFQLSETVLKWILENIKFLNHSVSSLVTKLKIIYWRFYYTEPFSWIHDNMTDLGDFSKLHYFDLQAPLIAPYGRQTKIFFDHYPELFSPTHPYLKPLMILDPFLSRRRLGSEQLYSPEKASKSMVDNLVHWHAMFKSKQRLRQVALELFLAVKYFFVYSRVLPNSTTYSSRSDKEILEFKAIEDMKIVGGANRSHMGTNLGQIDGLFNAASEERHEWYGCPHAIEYYALMTEKDTYLPAELENLRNNPKFVCRALLRWGDIIDALASSKSSLKLHSVLSRLFRSEIKTLVAFGYLRGTPDTHEYVSPYTTLTGSRDATSSQNGEEDGLMIPVPMEIGSDEIFAHPPRPAAAAIFSLVITKMQDIISSAFEVNPSFQTPLDIAFTFSDVGLLNRRFNPNILASQNSFSLSLISDLDDIKIAEIPAPRRQQTLRRRK